MCTNNFTQTLDIFSVTHNLAVLCPHKMINKSLGIEGGGSIKAIEWYYIWCSSSRGSEALKRVICFLVLAKLCQ